MANDPAVGRTWMLWGFFHWDKARERRSSLVEAFMRSKWNPGDLVLAAKEPWLLRKIAKRVLNRWQGQEYLARALVSIPVSAGPLREELSEILRDPRRVEFEDWD